MAGSLPLHLWPSDNNPFNLLLTVLAIVSYLTHDLKGAIVIASMVMLSTLLRLVQVRCSNRAALALKELVRNTATVIRRVEQATGEIHPPKNAPAMQPPGQIELPIKQRVPGDIVLLSAGDMIPADCRVMTAKDLFVSLSAMTGESLPVEKFPDAQGQAQTQAAGALEMANLVFMGTNVVSGSASTVVLATGNHTYFGTE